MSDYVLYSDAAVEATEMVQSVSRASSATAAATAATTVSVSSVSVSGSSLGLASLWHFVDVAQIIYVYQLINIRYPPNLDAFFNILSFSQLDFLPNAFEYVVDEDMLVDQDGPQRY